jgi:deoxyribonuclease-2
MRNLFKSFCAFFAASMAYPLCKSDSGSAVDAWVLFKGPKGTDYVYWDIETPLVASPHDLNSTSTGALAQTLDQLWSESTTDYILWNDDPPGSTEYNFTVGHTKGVWAWNTKTGDAIIVQHSIPLFPAGPTQTQKYVGLGSNAWMYGQHAACFHTTVDALNELAGPALLTIPSIYDSRIHGDTPAGLALLAGGASRADPVCEAGAFLTSGGLNVTYFAKSTEWNNELYAACVAPALQTSLAVESWIRGSACGPACPAGGSVDVLDISGVSYPGGLAFSEYNDHSKWAVSAAMGAEGDWFCPADINRMTTQFKRGGGGYCFKNSELATAMRAAITGTDAC